jgi:hypothetical protein
MSTFWQTVIAATIPVLVAGRVALTRTSRLQRTINTNVDLLGRLPAEHPNRAALEIHNGELLGLLVRRQQRRFGPFTQAGVSFGALAGVATVALAFAGFAAVLATGVLPSASASAAATSPPDPGDQWAAAAFFLVIAVSCAVFMVRAARRQLREHPPSAEQPSEAGLAPD